MDSILNSVQSTPISQYRSSLKPLSSSTYTRPRISTLGFSGGKSSVQEPRVRLAGKHKQLKLMREKNPHMVITE
jgi:hypothetical protein